MHPTYSKPGWKLGRNAPNGTLQSLQIKLGFFALLPIRSLPLISNILQLSFKESTNCTCLERDASNDFSHKMSILRTQPGLATLSKSALDRRDRKQFLKASHRQGFTLTLRAPAHGGQDEECLTRNYHAILFDF